MNRLAVGVPSDLLSRRDTAVAKWRRPPHGPLLDEREVHVWRVRLDLPASLPRAFDGWLTASERARADSYVFTADRGRFTVLRAALRVILGGYMGIDPGEVPLTYGPHGKPIIAAGANIACIHFNVSHSDGLGLIAVARRRRVGVDLEAVRVGFAWKMIAERFFSTRECEYILSLPASDQNAAFSGLWTRKEAALKAAGLGLANGLEEIEVSADLHQGPVLLRAPADMLPLTRWELIDLAPGEGFRGCLVVEGRDTRLKKWTWSGV